MDMNMEMIKHFTLQNPSMMDGFNMACDFPLETFLAHQHPEFPAAIYSHNNLLTAFQVNNSLSAAPVKTITSSEDHEDVFHENKKRKLRGQSTSSSENVSPTVSTATSNSKKSSGKEKRRRSKGKEQDKAEEIIHVRAKRGHATDNHSLAERLRREKINQKLRCLQDLVPGCNRTMGMVVMLEEIINYVHSLQNQVEFLSMELGAASSSNVQSFEAESSIKAQGTNPHEAQEMENWVRNQHGELSCFHATWPF